MNRLVSIVMTVYNAEEYLAESIQSILNQTFTDYEFIIIDDCSTDHSLQIAQEYQKKDPRIIIHHHQQNLGIGGARNTGVNLAQGKYIAWMDADDVSMPERIEKEVSYLESNPQVGVISSNANLINRIGDFIDEVHMPQTHLLIEWAFSFYDPIINPAVMVRRDLYTKIGEYRNLAINKGEYFPEDYDLWVRMIRETQFHNLNQPLLNLRKHEQNITKTRYQSMMKNSVLICGWYLQSLNIPSIKASDARLIWSPVYFSTLFPTIRLIDCLYRFFVAKPEITQQEKEYIQKDFMQRIKLYMSQVHFGFSKLTLYFFLKIKENQMKVRE